MKGLIYVIANEVYWKSFIDKGFWIFTGITIFITEILFAIMHTESSAYIFGENFTLQYFLIFFGIFTATFYPIIHYWGEKRRRKIREGN